MNYSELLQLAKGWGNFVSDRINIWRLRYEGIKRAVIIRFDDDGNATGYSIVDKTPK